MNNTEEYRLLDRLFDELFPLLRSISGEGIERSLKIMSTYMPLDICGVDSGTEVFDWVVPKQWNCRSARLIGPKGEVICDLQDCNLHVINYSMGVDVTMPLDELQHHLYSLPDKPEAIPYVTSYYNRTWGFCLAHAQRERLQPGLYRAQIDADFSDGRVPYAHTFLEGTGSREILISSYLCHPSLANNELSGPLVLLGLYNRIKDWPIRQHRFRFVLNPETIGSLCYLFRHGKDLQNSMDAGLVLTCLGGAGGLSYKASRLDESTINQLARHWNQRGEKLELRPFSPATGSDERQFCSPGFNFPVGQMARTIYGEYEGYHNSLDTKEFMTISALIDSIDQIERFLKELDYVGPWKNKLPYGEPQLGRRGLYPNINSATSWQSSSDCVFDGRKILERILYALNYSDGHHNMIEISQKCNSSIQELIPVVMRLQQEGLLVQNGRMS